MRTICKDPHLQWKYMDHAKDVVSHFFVFHFSFHTSVE